MTPTEQAWLLAAGKRSYRVKKRLSVSEWADQHRLLSQKSSAFAGRWQTATAPYQREPMDAFGDPRVREIALLWGAQLGKSDVSLNCMGWMVSNQAGPSLFLQPTDADATDFKRSRFDPMVDECALLNEIIPSKKLRDGTNSEDSCEFSGGSISFRGVQKPRKVKSRPIRYIFADEIDDWPLEIGTQDNKQGDPLALADLRTTGFFNKKTLLTSTPTSEGRSRIWARFLNSTQEHFYVPCPNPACRHPQVMSFDRLNRETIEHSCEACGRSFRQAKWYAQQRQGFWKAHAEHKRNRGFMLHTLYSPFLTWEELNDEWTRAEEDAKSGDERKLKVFVNARRCELWFDRGGNRLKHDELFEKRVVYAHPVPDQVLLLTSSIDYQSGKKDTGEGAKLKYSIYGWASERTGFLIEAGTIWAGADDDKAIKQVDELVFDRVFEKSDDSKLQVIRLFFDSGNLPDPVYKYCTGKLPRAWPIKGHGGPGKPIVKPGKSEDGRHPIVIIGVDGVKDWLLRKLHIEALQPGSLNFPKLEDGSVVSGADEAFFKELTAEYRKAQFKNNNHYYSWERVSRSADNDFGDCLVYAFAALEHAGGKAKLLELAKGDAKSVHGPKFGMIETGSLSFHPDARPRPSVQPASPKPTADSPKGPLDPSIQKFKRVGRFRMPGEY